jgi:uncharacterized membrane protein
MRFGIVAFGTILALSGVLLAPRPTGATETIEVTFQTIDAPGADNTFAIGISNKGDIVGYYTYPPRDANGYEASNVFVLDAGDFSTFAYPGAYYSYGNGINDSQVVVGNCKVEAYGTLGTCQNYYGTMQGWVTANLGGSFSLLNFPTGALPNATQAQGINNKGQIVGVFEHGSGIGTSGYLLSKGSYTTVNPPGAPTSAANGINDAGQIVGYFCPTASCQGFLLSGIGGTYTTISFPGAYATYAAGINNLGDVVGYFYCCASGPAQGFVFHSKTGAFELISDPLGFGGASPYGSGTFATGINDAGQVVGYYIDSSGAAHGFIAREKQF